MKSRSQGLLFALAKQKEEFEQGGSRRSLRKETVRWTVFADGVKERSDAKVHGSAPKKSLTLRHEVRLSMIQWATVLPYFSAEKVLIGITQKVLEMLNRIIFSADSGILANQVILYCVFTRLGISIKELFSKLFPNVISVVRVEKSTLFLYIFKGK